MASFAKHDKAQRAFDRANDESARGGFVANIAIAAAITILAVAFAQAVNARTAAGTVLFIILGVFGAFIGSALAGDTADLASLMRNSRRTKKYRQTGEIFEISTLTMGVWHEAVQAAGIPSHHKLAEPTSHRDLFVAVQRLDEFLNDDRTSDEQKKQLHETIMQIFSNGLAGISAQLQAVAEAEQAVAELDVATHRSMVDFLLHEQPLQQPDSRD